MELNGNVIAGMLPKVYDDAEFKYQHYEVIQGKDFWSYFKNTVKLRFDIKFCILVIKYKYRNLHWSTITRNYDWKSLQVHFGSHWPITDGK